MYFFITFFVFSIRDKGLFQRKNLNPIIIRVIDEIQSHLFILEANTAHFLVELAYFIVIACHTETKMAFVFSQFVGFRMVAQPGQFQ